MIRERLQPVPHPQIQRVEVQVYGARNYPLGSARVPLAMLENFEPAYEAFRAAYPTYTMEQFIRYIFEKGLRAATIVVRSHNIPTPKELLGG